MSRSGKWLTPPRPGPAGGHFAPVEGKATPGSRTWHHCEAEGCRVRIPAHLFMCKVHWFSVPIALRYVLSEKYRPGQEAGLRPMSAQWAEAAKLAIQIVKDLESGKMRILWSGELPPKGEP